MSASQEVISYKEFFMVTGGLEPLIARNWWNVGLYTDLAEVTPIMKCWRCTGALSRDDLHGTRES